MSDTVKFKHHAIDIPTLTQADRIIEAARDINDAIRQQPKKAPLEEREAIELLREVLLGEKKDKVPPNSVQTRRDMEQNFQRETPNNTQNHLEVNMQRTESLLET